MAGSQAAHGGGDGGGEGGAVAGVGREHRSRVGPYESRCMRHGKSTHSNAGRVLVGRRKSPRRAEDQQSTGREKECVQGSAIL